MQQIIVHRGDKSGEFYERPVTLARAEADIVLLRKNYPSLVFSIQETVNVISVEDQNRVLNQRPA
jgi:hypothetical protein